MKSSLIGLMLFFCLTASAAIAKEDCTPGGGWACDPGTPEPKPYCPWGHTCPWKFVMNGAGDLVIYQDKTPVAILPKADVRWHPAILKSLMSAGVYKTDSIEVLVSKEPSTAISPKSPFKVFNNKGK